VTLLRFDGVSVEYPRQRHAGHRRTALRSIDLEVHRGELLGVVGHNGSGKTTLLQAAAGVFPVTAGSICVNGRVASLVELSAGFHLELSGRENVLLGGVLLGMSRRSVGAAYAEIVAFSGLDEEVLDEPVRTYSAGMTIRLAFALAIHGRPDVVLVDEVLAVGDESFRRRCRDRMEELRELGSGLVFATHDLDLLRDDADRVAVLDHGRLVTVGPPAETLDAYVRSRDEPGLSLSSGEPPPPTSRGRRPTRSRRGARR
jgi:ABC-type polysaccharide/polyol phosphate transport system ATPase subunit